MAISVCLIQTSDWKRSVCDVMSVTTNFSQGLFLPRQAREFGRALGQLAKTDCLDAPLLARMAAVLVAELPELGCLNGREIPALVGVPPEPGQRPVPGPASGLEWARLRAHDPLHGYGHRYPPQPRHPLLLILNAVLRDQVPWQPDCMSVAGEV